MSEVYDEALKVLAARPAQRLDSPTASARLDNPLCGDTVTLDLRMEGGRLSALGHGVKGCLLCKASAAVAVERLVGFESAQATALAEAVASWLRQGGEPPLPELASFAPVMAHKSRHTCVTLPFKALAKALAGA